MPTASTVRRSCARWSDPGDPPACYEARHLRVIDLLVQLVDQRASTYTDPAPR